MMINKKYFERENLMKGWLTMTKSKQRRSLRGAVLIMVLTVMLVLIIMLMATLTVVTTAGQRIYTKFEENQAYYTARSALDVFTSNMLGDSAYIAYNDSNVAREYTYTKEGGTPGVSSDELKVKMKQGLALQLDLYKIASQNEDGVDLKWLENAVVGDGTFASSSAEEKNYTLQAGVDHTGKYPNGLPYIEYDITFPTVTSSTDANAYGKIVDIDKDDIDKDGDKTDQVARIRVEVLDRKLHTATQFTDAEITAATTATTPSIADIQAAVAGGVRSKDYMKIKITATVQMMDTEGVAVVIFETTEKDTPATDNALTTTGSFSGGSGAQVRTAGGVSTMDVGVSFPGDGNNMSGSMFSLGHLLWVSSAGTQLNKGESIVAWGGLASSDNGNMIVDENGNPFLNKDGTSMYATHNDLKIIATDDDTYVFLGGTSVTKKNDTFGDATHNVSVIADKIIKRDAQNLTVNGNLYVNTFDYQSGNPQKVSVTGTMYVKNLILPGDGVTANDYVSFDSNGVAIIDLTKVCAGGTNFKMCNDYTITIGTKVFNSSNYATGTNPWRVKNPAGGEYTTKSAFEGAYWIDDDGFDINDFDVVKNEDRIYRKYSLPFQVDGKNEIEVPTAQAYFAEYFKDGAFHETGKMAGDIKNYNDQTNANPAHANNAYNVIYGDTNKQAWMYDAADMLEEYLDLPAVATGSPSRTIASMAANTTEISNIEALPASGGTITLDSGDKFFLLSSGTYANATWHVTGTNGRAIFLIPENANITFDQCYITTDDINTTTAAVKDGVTKAPRVDIYAGTGASLTSYRNSFYAAYFMMPTATLHMDNGKSALNYTNSASSTTAISNVGIVGSVLCGDFTESNQTGIVYLNKDSGAETPGEPHLSVQASHYARK